MKLERVGIAIAVSGVILGGALLTVGDGSLLVASHGPAKVRFTVDEGTNISISSPPGAQSVIMDLHGFLYRIPGNGGRAVRITDIGLDAARPEVSPNGQRVAFQGYDAENGGYFHIVLVDSDGTDVRRLTSGHFDHREPVWSRDGTRVAFSSDRPTGQFRPPLQDAALGSYNIWSANPTTGELRLWADTLTAEEGEPTWSPNGAEIAYVVSNRIEAVNEAGVRRTIIPQRSGLTVNSPSWAPAGTDIAYVGSSGTQANLWLNTTQITTGQDVFRFSRPQWVSATELLYAADGKIRVIDINTRVSRDVPFTAELEMPKLSYEKKRYDFDTKKSQQVLGIVAPVISPSGKQVVFQALNDLWLLDIERNGRGDDDDDDDGDRNKWHGWKGKQNNPRRVTNDSFYEVDPAWSADGRYLAYSSDKSGTEDIYVRDMMSGSERRVTSLNGAEVSAVWSPDGRTIAFQTEAFETHTVDVNTGVMRRVIAELFAPGRPSFSADGNYIALASRMRYSTRFREGHNQILTVNLTTGLQTYHQPGSEFGTITTRGYDGPAWSPDGRWMAMVLEGMLHVLPVDNTGKPTGPALRLNDHATDSISWAGDSYWILYLNNGELKMVSRDGRRKRSVPLDLTYRNAEGPSRQIIHAGKFWDGASPKVRENVDIEVVGNRIKSVRPHRNHGQGTKVVDASRLFVMPGLWDTHFHREREIRFFADRTNRAQLAYGMTSTLAPGDVAYSSVENREAVRAGLRVGPRGFASGEPIDGARTHLDHFRGVVNNRQIALELSRVRALQYDYVKTYVRTSALVKSLVSEGAHRYGVPVGTHLMSPGFYVGVDQTAHLAATQRLGYARTVTDNSGLSYKDVIGAYAPRSMMTTIGGFDVLSDHVCPGTDPRLRVFANWKLPECETPPAADPECLSVDCRHTRSFKRFHNAGALIMTGTDFPLGSDVMLQLQAELRTLVQYGHWTPYEALRASIYAPAKLLGILDDLGTAEPGKLADLIMVEGNPLQHVGDAINVKLTMVNGILRSVEEIIAPFPGTGNHATAPIQHRWRAAVPDHPANRKYWWHRPEWVKEDRAGVDS
jgi:Tol biopolymer transport system component/imidazolonepropionase-like amidohydrolase